MVFTVVIILFGIYFFKNRDQFQVLFDIPFLNVVLIAVMQLLVISTNILFLWIFLLVKEKKDSWLTLTKVTFRSSIINFFGFLQGGVGYRAYYLKRFKNISLADFAGLMFINYWAVFVISSLLGTVGLIIQGNILSSYISSLLALFFAGVIIALSALSFIPKGISNFFSWHQLIKVSQLFDHIRHNKKFLLIFMVVALLQYVSSTLLFYLTLNAIGANLTIGGLLVYSSLAQFSILIALTPAAIGLREGLLIILQDTVGVNTQEIILSATLERAVYFVLLIILALFLSGRIKKPTKNQLQN